MKHFNQCEKSAVIELVIEERVSPMSSSSLYTRTTTAMV